MKSATNTGLAVLLKNMHPDHGDNKQGRKAVNAVVLEGQVENKTWDGPIGASICSHLPCKAGRKIASPSAQSHLILDSSLPFYRVILTSWFVWP